MGRMRRKGTVQLNCQMLITKYGTIGRDTWCMLRLKIDEVYVLPSLLLPKGDIKQAHYLLGLGLCMVARVGDVEKMTPWAKYYIRNPEDQHHRGPKSAQGGKTLSELKQQEGANESDADMKMLELEIEFVLYLPVRKAETDTAKLQLELQSREQGIIGSREVPLRMVKLRKDLRLDHDE